MLADLLDAIPLPLRPNSARGRRDDLLRARDALVGDPSTSGRDRRLLERVDLRVHRRDQMYEPGRGEHYLSVGLSALECIDRAWGSRPDPRDVLDFGCGYGRVLRFLPHRYPDANLLGVEIEGAAFLFGLRKLGIPVVGSVHDLTELDFRRRFDLIWCGSLVTHLDGSRAVELLDLFARHLTADGMCVFSAHGESTVRALREGTDDYGLPEERRRAALSEYDVKGYGYADYPGMSGYGISVATPDELRSMARRVDLDIVSHQIEAWDAHHDVYAAVPR